MKTTQLLILALAASFAARADFSYTQTTKASQGTPQAMKFSFKGSRMLVVNGDTTSIIDVGTQTMTTIDKPTRTYSVKKLGENMPAGSDKIVPRVDVKETGQKKTINGFNCSQTVMTMSMDAPGARAGTTMRIEMELWVSPDVPGWQNMRAFYQKNSGAMGLMAGGNSNIRKAMSEMQKKLASMNGMAVLQTVRVKSAGPNDAKVAQARARLEEIVKQGGQQAEGAKQALALMPGGGGLFETTMESSGFSSADIPEALFAIPAGFTQKQ